MAERRGLVAAAVVVSTSPASAVAREISVERDIGSSLAWIACLLGEPASGGILTAQVETCEADGAYRVRDAIGTRPSRGTAAAEDAVVFA